MFSLRAPTQPAKPSVNVTPPTSSTNQTGSKPWSWVTWVRSIRTPFTHKRPAESNNQYPVLPARWPPHRWCPDVRQPSRSTPRTQPQWRPPPPAAESGDTDKKSPERGRERWGMTPVLVTGSAEQESCPMTLYMCQRHFLFIWLQTVDFEETETRASPRSNVGIYIGIGVCWCVWTYPKHYVVAEHQVLVAAADLGGPISIVVHLGHSKTREALENTRFAQCFPRGSTRLAVPLHRAALRGVLEANG